MGFLNLSKNIVRLRKKKEITQEALAEFVGVTKAAVSKWETGTTTPDIQILPVLAAFFDVSVDELIGYEARLTGTQIRYYYHKLAQNFAKQPFDEVWKESQELVKKYYGCYPFLMQMAVLWLNHSTLAGTKEQCEEVLKHTEEVCTRIIENTEDSAVRENARSIRGIVWLQQNRADLIIDSLEKEVMDINMIGDKGALLPLAYLASGKLDMAKKSSQIGLYRNLMGMINSAMYLLMSASEEQYCREVMHRTDQVLEVFQVEKLYPNGAAGYQYQAALTLGRIAAAKCENGTNTIQKEDENEIYCRLEKFAQSVAQLYQDGIKIHADDFFYRLGDWFEELELGTEPVRDGRVILTDTMKSLEHPVFSILEDRRRMERIAEKMKNITKKVEK